MRFDIGEEFTFLNIVDEFIWTLPCGKDVSLTYSEHQFLKDSVFEDKAKQSKGRTSYLSIERSCIHHCPNHTRRKIYDYGNCPDFKIAISSVKRKRGRPKKIIPPKSKRGRPRKNQN